MTNTTKSGFVAIVGRPNVGKSTLLNQMIGEKISIVSQKPQTTRTKITAVLNDAETQMVFLDTPGYFKPKNRLGEYMAEVVNSSIADVDVVVLVVEVRGEMPQKAETEIIEALKARNLPAILVINKIDTIAKERILPVIDVYSRLYDFLAIIPISAKQGEGVADLVLEIKKKMPEGPWLFEEDMLTDQTERQIAADMIREKLLGELSDEVPHGTAVEVILMQDGNNGCLNISANIYCEKESHKGIIIGKKGDMLKRIGSLARISMEEFFQTKVYLQLWVKVKEDWRNKENIMRNMGFK